MTILNQFQIKHMQLAIKYSYKLRSMLLIYMNGHGKHVKHLSGQ